MASSFIVDSIDVFHPSRTHYTSTADGRYAFTIEYTKPNFIDLDDDGQSDDEFAYLAIFSTDLFLSRKTSFGLVGPLYSFGFNVAFYALDADSVVVVDFHENDQLIRQRLISIDWKTNTAECEFYRMYKVQFHRWMEWSTSVGEHIAVTASDTKNGIVYPVNPLSSAAHIDISDLLERADNFVHRRRQGVISTIEIDKAFVITHQAVGLFICYPQYGNNNHFDGYIVDLRTAIVLDLQRDTFYLTDVEGPVDVPLESRVIRWGQTNDREVTASYTDCNLRSGLAVLNTRTMEWCAIQSHPEVEGIVPSRDGSHIIIYQKPSAEDTSIRSISSEVEEQREESIRTGWAPKRERFHLIRHPCKISSLARLVAIAVQKSGGLPADWLPVADRLG